MKFTLFASDTVGNAKNCIYPHSSVVDSPAALASVVGHDHTCGKFKGNYRAKENFQWADCIIMDVDNDTSDNPADWIDAKKLMEDFADVQMAIIPSRNDGKAKDGKTARPKKHVAFPIEKTTDAARYAALKAAVQRKYPYFDGNALDAARFLYGSEVKPEDIVWNDGWMTIEDMAADGSDDECLEDELSERMAEIPAGVRNKTLSRFVGRVLMRFGDTEKARELFEAEALKCVPPLERQELENIYKSGKRFLKKIQQGKDYVPPEEYEVMFGKAGYLKPEDYSDIGQAKVLASVYGDRLCCSGATGFLRYDGKVWMESKYQSIGGVEEFSDLQLADAKDILEQAEKALMASGISEQDIAAGGKAIEKQIDGDEQRKLFFAYLSALSYKTFTMKRRDMKFIVSAMEAAKPMLEVKANDLDRDPFSLNCQDGTYDLTEGMSGRHDFNPDDLCTKICNAAPGDEGKELWEDFLHTIFLGDAELIEYVQRICGLGAIGIVYLEAVIISYGDGANGKSTFWNTIAWVLGSYAGGISADALTIGCRRNVKPEIAETMRKRLLIAAELEDGVRLSTSIVKQLCSTDRIKGEKKYKDPFDFVPSHTLVLYTNHLPRIGAMDHGIWRRLIVIPFNATIKGGKDIKNYAGYLQKNAGAYILKWIIEGAGKAVKENYSFDRPRVVEEAIKKYRSDNDWLAHFLEECCELGAELREKSGEFYSEYRAYCFRNGDFTRSTTEFYNALQQRGFERIKRRDGRFIVGVKLRDEELVF